MPPFSLPRRVTALAAAAGAALALSSCGFTPLYADRDGTLSQTLGAIEIMRIGGRAEAGYALQSELQQRIGNGDEAPRYSLTVALEESQESEAITKSATTVRYNYIVEAEYRLRTLSGKVVLSEETIAIASYSAATSQYATEIARDDARLRASMQLADRIERDIVLYLRGLEDVGE